MRLPLTASVLLAVSRYTSAKPQDVTPQDNTPQDDETQGDETEDVPPTITSSATLACATGAAAWASCSSSVSSGIVKCAGDDLLCACRHANLAFNCLTSYCPHHTAGICEASLALHALCGPGPSLTHLSCSSDTPELLASLVPSEAWSLIPTVLGSLVPANIDGARATGGASFGAPGETVAAGSGGAEAGPSVTGNAAAGDGEGLRWFLGCGIVVSVAVGGLAAWL